MMPTTVNMECPLMSIKSNDMKVTNKEIHSVLQ